MRGRQKEPTPLHSEYRRSDPEIHSCSLTPFPFHSSQTIIGRGIPSYKIRVRFFFCQGLILCQITTKNCIHLENLCIFGAKKFQFLLICLLFSEISILCIETPSSICIFFFLENKLFLRNFRK